MELDKLFMQRAIELAIESEKHGNPPVGAVITLDDRIISEGAGSILVPKFDGTRHAEMEALRAVPSDLWSDVKRMSIYTTLEPCLMCFSSILIHGIPRIVFGAIDPYGGAGCVHSHLPPYFDRILKKTQWVGPIMPNECDPIFHRLCTRLGESKGELI